MCLHNYLCFVLVRKWWLTRLSALQCCSWLGSWNSHAEWKSDPSVLIVYSWRAMSLTWIIEGTRRLRLKGQSVLRIQYMFIILFSVMHHKGNSCAQVLEHNLKNKLSNKYNQQIQEGHFWHDINIISQIESNPFQLLITGRFPWTWNCLKPQLYYALLVKVKGQLDWGWWAGL